MPRFPKSKQVAAWNEEKIRKEERMLLAVELRRMADEETDYIDANLKAGLTVHPSEELIRRAIAQKLRHVAALAELGFPAT